MKKVNKEQEDKDQKKDLQIKEKNRPSDILKIGLFYGVLLTATGEFIKNLTEINGELDKKEVNSGAIILSILIGGITGKWTLNDGFATGLTAGLSTICLQNISKYI